MSNRAWILVLMVVVFLAGAAAGVLSERLSADRTDLGPMDDYSRLLAEEFQLSPDRMAHLRTLMGAYTEDVERVVREHEAAYLAGLEPDLRPIGEEYDRLVRDLVLPPEHRQRFDELAQGITLNPQTN